MHHTDIHPFRTIKRGAVLVATTLVFLLAAAPAANAAPSPVNVTERAADVQFTNCPSTIPTHDNRCFGTDVFVDSRQGTVEGTPVTVTTITVAVVTVTQHPDGTFDVHFPPVITGSASSTLSGTGTDGTTINQSVPMSDGSTADINVTLTATGPLHAYRFQGPINMPECASGFANVEIHGSEHDQIASGFAIIRGRQQHPTSDNSVPFMFNETQKGSCGS